MIGCEDDVHPVVDQLDVCGDITARELESTQGKVSGSQSSPRHEKLLSVAQREVDEMHADDGARGSLERPVRIVELPLSRQALVGRRDV